MSAATPTYSVAVANGGFEDVAVTSTSRYQQNQSGASWLFVDRAGVSLSSSTITSGVPAFPQGSQVGYVMNAGKIVQRVWIEPGDSLTFRATQVRNRRTGKQSISVAVDGVPVGSRLTPSDLWDTVSVPLPAAAPSFVNLEIRGLTTSPSETRGALIDAMSITRAASTIADAGLPAQVQRPIMSDRTELLGAGVVGVLKNGDSELSMDTPALALAEWNNVVFVGGKFANVQRGSGAPLEDQQYLAAFDRATGAWIDTFRPRLDGTVWDLAVTPSGKLLVAGQFTNVNGAPRTSALALLDPSTGAVVPGWQADVQSVGWTDRPVVRSVDIQGDSVYVGGFFNRITGLDGVTRVEPRIAQLALADGMPRPSFAASIAGTVYAVDATPGRVYTAGRFSTVNGEARSSFAVLDATTGASVPGMKQMLFTRSDPTHWYQHAVLAFDDQVWIGGSEHSAQVYSPTDMSRLRVFTSYPYGDVQAFAARDGYLYAGSHASGGTYEYTDATDYLSLSGWTTKDPVRWVAAFDLTKRTVVPTWYPSFGMSSSAEGIWDLMFDSAGCMWAAGDVNRGSSTSSGYRYAKGFAKFCPVDAVAPTAPSSPVAATLSTGVTLTWGASTDDRGGVRYEVLRNDRIVAQGLSVRSYTDASGSASDRYFVRAVDLAGNRSATTSVIVPGAAPPDTTNPKTPKNLSCGSTMTTAGVCTLTGGKVTLTWTASTDNVAVAGYNVYQGKNVLRQVTGTTTSVTGLVPGTYWFQVQAFDAAGNVSFKTPSVQVNMS